MTDDLYYRDFSAWIERQAANLRQLSDYTGLNVERVAQQLEAARDDRVARIENAWIAAIGYALVWAVDEDPRCSMRENVNGRIWSWHYEYRDRILDNLTTASTQHDPGMLSYCNDQRMSELFDEAVDFANFVLVKQEAEFRFRRTRDRSCYVTASDLLACTCSQDLLDLVTPIVPERKFVGPVEDLPDSVAEEIDADD